VPRQPTRDEAARILGVSPTAPPIEIRHAYRRLVRQRHPDVGGDAAAFQQLQQAYEYLAAAAHRPAGTGALNRTTPSRPGGRRQPPADDPDAVAWGPLPDPAARLDAAALRSLLVQPAHHIRAASRGPGSRLNAVAHLLAAELTTVLTVGAGRDDLGRPLLVLTLRGVPRRSRRSLDRADLAGVWIRTRGSSVTRLTSGVPRSGDRRRDAAQAVARHDALLSDMRWPLHEWRLRA